ncbi:lambda-crystallin-like [Mizuhopecten yessoensis]|uniref:Lambda-crystallin-like n=1 Tax=Mizuhopecten yessoensis TaxID=6573 RepID=A0A210Q8F7_MIZYE|nr:lambda-crystallin-like [Mizuhopecten yessoensis]OWF45011.1 Lambda-crystallin-like [Mizuhopecten yessoensis]
MAETKIKQDKICIVGSGLIGRSFAMLFAASGYQVYLYDIQLAQVTDALDNIRIQLLNLEGMGLLRGTLTVDQQHSCIKGASDLGEAIKGAWFVLECVPERLDLKTVVYKSIDPLLEPNAILGSSASALVPSLLSKDLKNRNRFIVVHPTNPPFYAPLVELVPAPWTDADVLPAIKSLCTEIGQAPVVLNKEIDGFVLNRIQYAIIGECWNLVKAGVMSSEDVDKVMSEGLGRRYAFMGPLETAYLNADGWLSYKDRYAEMMERVTSNFEPFPKIEGPTLQKIHDEFARKIPLDQLDARREWRDARLAQLSKLKKEMDK